MDIIFQFFTFNFSLFLSFSYLCMKNATYAKEKKRISV